MKILHAIETLGYGGAEQLLVNLLPELGRQGIESGVIVRRAPLSLLKPLEEAGIPVTVMPKMGKWNLVGSARCIARAAHDMKADVIHSHMYFPAVSTSLTRKMAMTTAKTCVTFHNLAYAGANRKTLRLMGKNRLARYLYPRGMCGYFAVSQAVADHYTEALGLAGIQVVHNAIDLTPMDHAVEFERTDPRLHVVVAGRLVPEKGHGVVLDALSMMGKDKTRLRVTFAGDGPMRSRLETSISEKDLGEQVSISGTLGHTDFLRVLSTADIVVAASHYEGFGLVALESMSLGRPVIATTAGGLPEVLGEAGLLVPPGDPKALKKAITKLMNDDDLRASVAERCRERARTHFSLSNMAKSLIEHYETMPDQPMHRNGSS